MSESQTTADVLMIRPVRFAGNEQTAGSNKFQQIDDVSIHADAVQALALTEFDRLADALHEAGVRTYIVDDTPQPHTPDSLFPNNWVSFHADGTVVLYPMLAPNRRLERRLDIIEALDLRHGFHVTQTADLTHRETEGKFLEGTGSLVLDRRHRVAYACLSPRTDMDVLGEFSQRLDYDIVAFDATDANGEPIYHTNVLMSVGEKFAVLCAECIEPSRREAVCHMLRSTGHEVIELTLQQVNGFAGNMLQLRTVEGRHIIAMSQTACRSLSSPQLDALEKHGRIVSADIPTIERLGGGSVRCMIAEVHLKKKLT